MSLLLSQPSISLTCVVSNQVGQKTATLDLGEVCVSGECTCQRGGALRELGALGFSPQEKRNLFLMQIKLVHLQMSNSQFQLALETEQVWCGGGQESWGCSSKSNP